MVATTAVAVVGPIDGAVASRATAPSACTSAVRRRSAAAICSFRGARISNSGSNSPARLADTSSEAIRFATRCDSLAGARQPSRRTSAFASACIVSGSAPVLRVPRAPLGRVGAHPTGGAPRDRHRGDTPPRGFLHRADPSSSDASASRTSRRSSGRRQSRHGPDFLSAARPTRSPCSHQAEYAREDDRRVPR
jgi:hypothetical protein